MRSRGLLRAKGGRQKSVIGVLTRPTAPQRLFSTGGGLAVVAAWRTRLCYCRWQLVTTTTRSSRSLDGHGVISMSTAPAFIVRKRSRGSTLALGPSFGFGSRLNMPRRPARVCVLTRFVGDTYWVTGRLSCSLLLCGGVQWDL